MGVLYSALVVLVILVPAALAAERLWFWVADRIEERRFKAELKAREDNYLTALGIITNGKEETP